MLLGALEGWKPAGSIFLVQLQRWLDIIQIALVVKSTSLISVSISHHARSQHKKSYPQDLHPLECLGFPPGSGTTIRAKEVGN